MIVGYLLFDSGGILLVDEQFVSLLTEERESLFASILTAITHAMSKILSEKPRHLELENLHVYLGYGGQFIFVLITDLESDAFLRLVDDILADLADSGLSPEQINFDPISKQAVKQLIRKRITKHPPSVEYLLRMVKILGSVSEFIKNKQHLDLKIYFPEETSISPKKPKISKKEIDINEIIQDFLDGRLEDVVEKARQIIGGEHGEFGKILFAKAGLILNMYGPQVRAPQLSEIKWAIDNIDDVVAREALQAQLDSFLHIAPKKTPFDVFAKNQDIIKERREREPLWRVIYDIVFTPIPWIPFLESIIKEYSGKSDFLVSMAKEQRAVLHIIYHPPKSVEDWLYAFSDARSLFEKSLEMDSPSKFHYFHVFLITLAWGILTPNMKIEDGFRLLHHFLEYIEKYQKEILSRSERILSTHRAQNYFIIYNVLMRPIFEGAEDEDRVQIASKKIDRLVETIREISNLAEKRRIPLGVYYTAITGLLSVLTRMLLEKNSTLEDIPRILERVIDLRMSGLWKNQNHYYVQYYMSVLDAIGNTASMIEIETIRNDLLIKVAYQFERLANLAEDMPIARFLASMHALRYYVMSGEDRGFTAAKRIFEEVKGKLSPFLVYILRRIYSRYVRGGEL